MLHYGTTQVPFRGLGARLGALYGVVHISQVDIFLFPVNVASRLPSGEGVDLIDGDYFCDFWTFQEELATIGTKNFANG